MEQGRKDVPSTGNRRSEESEVHGACAGGLGVLQRAQSSLLKGLPSAQNVATRYSGSPLTGAGGTDQSHAEERVFLTRRLAIMFHTLPEASFKGLTRVRGKED